MPTMPLRGIRAKTDHARAFFFALDLVLRTSMHALFFSRMIVPDAPTGQRGTMIVPYAHNAHNAHNAQCPYGAKGYLFIRA